MNLATLLAKSSSSSTLIHPWATLDGHITRAMETGVVLVDEWGKEYLFALGLPLGWLADLREALLIALLIHDLGKANQQFQQLVRKKGGFIRQAVRHEVVGLHWILTHPSFNAWLFTGQTDRVRQAALSALIGHHIKFNGFDLIRDGSGDLVLKVFGGHRQVQGLLVDGARILGRPAPPTMGDFQIDLLDGDLVRVVDWFEEAQAWFRGAGREERRFAGLVRSLTVAADLAASAIPRADGDPAAWTGHTIARVCTSRDLEQVAAARLDGHELRPFQRLVAASEHRVTLVTAGCGSGKTCAAYLWAANHAKGRKLFVCYPTTGTATEGFADYILPHNRLEASLIHSRAALDLEGLLEDPEVRDEQIRIEALSAWDVPLIVCTADTVLGLMQQQRRGVFSFPSIGRGAFVFDEIHSYDDRMFRALLLFLECFRGVPVLLMTASLPPARLEAIRSSLSAWGEELGLIAGPADLEMIPRYSLNAGYREPPWALIEAAFDTGGKVLWVVNTVARCIEAAKACKERGLPVLPYHSRYRYCDRIRRHDDVVQAFRDKGAVLAVTTQVCEMSLDISADLLITDLAPIPALIQRLGRLNRRVNPDRLGQPCACLVVEPKHPAPYRSEELGLARQWLAELGTGPVSQRDLSDAFVSLAPSESFARLEAAWLQMPVSCSAPLRDPGYTLPVIRWEDGHVKTTGKDVLRVAIPMPVGPVANEVSAWKRVGIARVAPKGRVSYDERWGAAWQAV